MLTSLVTKFDDYSFYSFRDIDAHTDILMYFKYYASNQECTKNNE